VIFIIIIRIEVFHQMRTGVLFCYQGVLRHDYLLRLNCSIIFCKTVSGRMPSVCHSVCRLSSKFHRVSLTAQDRLSQLDRVEF